MASGAAGAAPAQMLETKVVILGHTGVGKTSMLHHFVRGDFPSSTTATIGAAYMRKTVKLKGWQVVLQIWDTAGQERFRSMAPMYYRGAQAAVLVYDVSVPPTLEKVHSWVEELQSHVAGAVSPTGSPGSADDIVLVIAGNKSDLRDAKGPQQAFVDQQQALKYAQSIQAPIFETSAKTGAGIEALFTELATTLLDRHLANAAQPRAAQGEKGEVQFQQGANGVKLESEKESSGGCCS